MFIQRILCASHDTEGEIKVRLEVVNDNTVTHVDRHAMLKSGYAVAFFCMDHQALRAVQGHEFPEADIYYTERQGDGIALLVPKGTAPDRLPSVACGYQIFEWIDPDKEFGTGVVIKHSKKDKRK